MKKGDKMRWLGRYKKGRPLLLETMQTTEICILPGLLGMKHKGNKGAMQACCPAYHVELDSLTKTK